MPFGLGVKVDMWLNFSQGTERAEGMLLYISFALSEMYDNGIIVKLPKSSVLQFVIIACHFLG